MNKWKRILQHIREGEEKERGTETEPDTEPRHITPHTHLPFLPPSVVFLMIHDKLVIAFGDESFMFLTFQELSEQAHVTNEMLHSAFFSQIKRIRAAFVLNCQKWNSWIYHKRITAKAFAKDCCHWSRTKASGIEDDQAPSVRARLLKLRLKRDFRVKREIFLDASGMSAWGQSLGGFWIESCLARRIRGQFRFRSCKNMFVVPTMARCEWRTADVAQPWLGFGSSYMKASYVFVLFIPDVTPACEPEFGKRHPSFFHGLCALHTSPHNVDFQCLGRFLLSQQRTMPEDCVVFISLILMMRNSRRSWKMRVESWKFRCQSECLASINVRWRTQDKVRLYCWSRWIYEETQGRIIFMSMNHQWSLNSRYKETETCHCEFALMLRILLENSRQDVGRFSGLDQKTTRCERNPWGTNLMRETGENYWRRDAQLSRKSDILYFVPAAPWKEETWGSEGNGVQNPFTSTVGDETICHLKILRTVGASISQIQTAQSYWRSSGRFV